MSFNHLLSNNSKPYIDDIMIHVASFANSIKPKSFDGSNFKWW
jgi:hypothetical protein